MSYDVFAFKKSLQSELNQVFNNETSCTKSAFCQARKKLKVLFFEDVFYQTVLSFYKHYRAKTFKNYRLWACDTSVQALPDNEETRKMGIHKNQHKSVASIKISVYFDVFNKLITLFELFDKRTADLMCCLKNQVKNIPKDVIAIYDRAYGSQILAFFHNLYGSKYVIRLKLDFSNTVKKFVQSADNDVIITEPIGERCYKELEKYGIRKSKMDMITYRLVKIILSTGETEVLMTNLDENFTISDLSEIYRLRWGVETAFNGIKNHQMLGTFSGYSELVIRQDIYCNLLFYNLHTISMLDSEEKLRKINERRKKKPSKNKKKENKGYQINRNVGTNTLRLHLWDLFTCKEKDLASILEKMQEIYIQSLEMIKDCDKERKRKMMRMNDRHHTEINYKRGF
jgi:hypothetical protein